MLKGEDIVVLLKLTGGARDWTVRALEEGTGVPRSVAHRSLKRLGEAGLVDEGHRRVLLTQSEEFLVHGLKYVFPPAWRGEARGTLTAWAAPPLADVISSSMQVLPPVWPDPLGNARGLALLPLHPAASEAARRDPELGERLALVDALRAGDARIRGVAKELLLAKLGGVAHSGA
ncbi:MAG: hypothetical protein JJE50_08850 [Actinomycetales bacterium]|nr:hypothetical protein [Actinomycetales bacterium]